MIDFRSSKTLFAAIGIALAAAIAACVLMCVAVIGDSLWLLLPAIALGAVGILAILATSIYAFAARRWWAGLAGLAALAASGIAAIATVILIAAGQHHPLKPYDDPCDDEQMVDLPIWESTLDDGSAMDNQIERGSWWTDGMHYYKVKSTGKRIVMQGGTLHEGGYSLTMEADNDTLRIARGPYTPFGKIGSRIGHYMLTLESQDPLTPYDSIELLVAFDTADDMTPIAALQRFDGDELRYELQAIYTTLQGNYGNRASGDAARQSLTFYGNGTVRMRGLGDEMPDTTCAFTLERQWDMPDNVMTLPDGRHFTIDMSCDSVITLYNSNYDDDIDLWAIDEPAVCTLYRTDRLNPWCIIANRRMLTPTMMSMMGEEARLRFTTKLPHYSRNPEGACHFGCLEQLNIHILNHWLDEQP